MTIAFIPARRGSERVPAKNHACVGGAPLWYRAAAVAWAAECSRIVISSDDPEILAVDLKCCDESNRRLVEMHARPERLATATSQIESAINHWLYTADPRPDSNEVMVLLQPTSPLRRPATVRRCVELLREHDLDSVLTVTMSHAPTFAGRLRGLYDENAGEDIAHRVIWNRPSPGHRPRSQDALSPVENGLVYAFTLRHFRETGCRMGGREAVVTTDRWEAFEIDEPEDVAVAQAIFDLGLVS